MAGEGTGKSLHGPGVSVALTLLQGSALFGGGNLTQQYPSISLTSAIGAFMTPSMLIHNSDLMIPIITDIFDASSEHSLELPVCQLGCNEKCPQHYACLGHWCFHWIDTILL